MRFELTIPYKQPEPVKKSRKGQSCSWPFLLRRHRPLENQAQLNATDPVGADKLAPVVLSRLVEQAQDVTVRVVVIPGKVGMVEHVEEIHPHFEPRAIA